MTQFGEPLPSARQQHLALSHLRTALAVLCTYDPGTSEALAANFAQLSGVNAKTHTAPPESETTTAHPEKPGTRSFTPARAWDSESKCWVNPASDSPQTPAASTDSVMPYDPAGTRAIRDSLDAHVQTEADALATLLSGPDRSCMVHVTVAFHDEEGTVRHAHGVAGRTTGATLRQFIIAARRQLEWLTDRLVVKRG